MGLDPTDEAAAPRRTTLRLTLECSNRCVFCGQRGLRDARGMDATDIASRLASARQRASEISFVGGEPTLGHELPEAVAEARRLGFRRIGIQSNGTHLTDEAFVRHLSEAGLTDVHFSLHGSEAAVHDYHTRVPGSFVRLLQAAGRARARDLTVVVNTVLTRSSFRSLGEMPRLLHTKGVAAWAVSLPRVGGEVRHAFDRIVPRLSMALPYALHAIHGARRLGLPAWLRGAPLCLLGPYAGWALSDGYGTYGETCAPCLVRSSCPGVDPVYLARYRGDELSARTDAHPAFERDDAPAELARMFVGEGEMAPPEDPHAPLRTSPKPGLPVLGS